MQSIDISPALESWYARHQGDVVHEAIRKRLQPLLDLAFGYHVLQLGPLPGWDLIRESRINHRIYGGTTTHSPNLSFCGHGDELPLESDSIDMLVAFHALDFDEHPHGSLREMQRVLRPHGHLVIIGFNPLSLLGFSQYLRSFRAGNIWHQHRPVSPGRLTDWLHLLDCQLDSVSHHFPIPLPRREPLRSWVSQVDNWAARHALPGGGIYVAHAIKHIGGIRRPWPLKILAGRRLAGLAVAPRPSPTSRQPPTKNRDLAA